MSEQTKIEEELKTNLSGELLENALDFVKTSGFAEHTDGTSGWYHLGERICFTVIMPNQLWIFFGHDSIISKSDYDNFPINDELKEFVWAHVHNCKRCGASENDNWKTCRGGDKIFFGRTFDDTCNCPILFENPDAEKFGKIKELVEAWKLCIAELKSTE